MIENRKKKKVGRGLVNKIINKLPFELHIPGYQFCGPGTKLSKRLARGDQGINPLDKACKEHDLAYSKNKDIKLRNQADLALADEAWQRVKAKDAGIGEKISAWAITNTMKLKSKLGMGLKKKSHRKKTMKKNKKKMSSKRKSLRSIVTAASKSIEPNNSVKKIISSALKGAKIAVKRAGGKSRVTLPRILPVSSKIGGFLPYLVPLFAGLSATGALAGGAAGVAKAINDAKAARKQLEESQRHNRTMESIALGKGLFLKPYKKGYGLCLKPYSGKGLKKKKKIQSESKCTT